MVCVYARAVLSAGTLHTLWAISHSRYTIGASILLYGARTSTSTPGQALSAGFSYTISGLTSPSLSTSMSFHATSSSPTRTLDSLNHINTILILLFFFWPDITSSIDMQDGGATTSTPASKCRRSSRQYVVHTDYSSRIQISSALRPSWVACASSRVRAASTLCASVL